jgi:hypothetical protein
MAITFSNRAKNRGGMYYVNPAISATAVGDGTFRDAPRGHFQAPHAQVR